MKKKKKIKIRRQWNIRPATRVQKGEVDYDRHRSKREMKKRIQDESQDQEGL